MIYDRIIGDSPANYTVYTPYIYMVLANPTYTLKQACLQGSLLTSASVK